MERLAIGAFASRWMTRAGGRREITTADIEAADRIFAASRSNLRTPDALHVAIARRLDATLVTLDRGMAAAARALGMAVSTP